MPTAELIFRWEIVEAGAGALELFGASLPANTTGPALVRRVLDRAAANGFTVLRTWAHTVTAQYALQVLMVLESGCWQHGSVVAPSGSLQPWPCCPCSAARACSTA